MKDTDSSIVPPFLREAWEQSGDQPLDGFEVLRACLEPVEMRSKGATSRQALMARVGRAPLRYAPFFARVSELFALDEETVSDLLSDEGWQRAPLPGVEFKEAPAPREGTDLVATVVRFAPGTRYPRHRHKEQEKVLILEGGYTDSEGQHYQAGDLHVMDPETSHAFRVDKEGCVAVSLADRRLAFENPLFRLLAKWIGR